MNYRTLFERDPSLVEDLLEYVDGNGTLVDRSGMDLTRAEIEAFAKAAEREPMVRYHKVGVSEPYTGDQLLSAGRVTARMYLDGFWVVGINPTTRDTPQLRIIQAGSEDDCWMGRPEIMMVKSQLSSELARRNFEQSA